LTSAAHDVAADAEHQLCQAIPWLAGATWHTDPSATQLSRRR
jgi:hypothetical protein